MINIGPRRGLSAVLAGTFVIASALVGTPACARDPVTDGQWYVKALDLASAHRISTGDGVKVGVIDTGVDPSHPDLKGSVISGADFTGLGNGNGLTDVDGHGTAIASLIAGHGRILGVAPRASVVSLRVSDGFTDSANRVGQAIRWAISHDVKIVVIASVYREDDLYLRQAIEAALVKDVVIVTGAGNKPRDTHVQYPALYPGVLAVGGTNTTGGLSPVSVTGAQVMLAAPSDGISVAHRNKQWFIATGTSNSAAIVAGAAALIRAKYPNMPAAEVIRRLTVTAIDKGPTGHDDQYGYGIVNITAALLAPVAPVTSGGTASTKASVPASTGLSPWLVLAIVVALLLVVALFVIWRIRRTS